MDIRQFAEALVGRAQSGLEQFAQALRTKDDEAYVSVIAQFVHYSGVFPKCILHLASRLDGERAFHDPSEPPPLNDYGSVVAAYLIPSIVDEYGKPGNSAFPTHRRQAVSFLNNVAKLLNIAPDRFTTLALPTITTNVVRNSCLDGYTFGSPFPTTKDLLEALGFHLFSERLAGSEFEVLRQNLQNERSQLGEQLKVGGALNHVLMHCDVEGEHAKDAIIAAETAIALVSRSGVHINNPAGSVADGCRNWLRVHKVFMQRLLQLSQ